MNKKVTNYCQHWPVKLLLCCFPLLILTACDRGSQTSAPAPQAPASSPPPAATLPNSTSPPLEAASKLRSADNTIRS